MKILSTLGLLSAALCLTSNDAHSMQRLRPLASELNPTSILKTSQRLLHTQGYRPAEEVTPNFKYDDITKRKVTFKEDNHERYWLQGEQKEKKVHIPDLLEKNDHTLIVDLDLKKKISEKDSPLPSTEDPQKTNQ